MTNSLVQTFQGAFGGNPNEAGFVDTIAGRDATGGSGAWDSALDVAEHSAVNQAVMAGSVAVPAAIAGVGAAAGGASATAAAGAAASAALPVAVVIGAGLVGAVVGDYLADLYAEDVGGAIAAAMGMQQVVEEGEHPACKGHIIAHKNTNAGLWGALLGAAAAVAVVAIAVAACGVGLVVLAAAAAVGGAVAAFASAVGNVLGDYGTPKGKILDGSPDVFFENKKVARMGDKIACDDHGPHKIAMGCRTVFVNDEPMARIGHKTTCDGNVNQGCGSIKATLEDSPNSLPINVIEPSKLLRTWIIVIDFLPIPRGGKSRPKSSAGGSSGKSGSTRAKTGTADGGGAKTPNGKASDRTPTDTKQSTKTQGKSTPECTGCADPVSPVTGRFLDYRTDISIPGTIPLTFHRAIGGSREAHGWARAGVTAGLSGWSWRARKRRSGMKTASRSFIIRPMM